MNSYVVSDQQFVRQYYMNFERTKKILCQENINMCNNISAKEKLCNTNNVPEKIFCNFIIDEYLDNVPSHEI